MIFVFRHIGPTLEQAEMDMRSQTTGNALKGRSAHAGGAEEYLCDYGVTTTREGK